MGRTGEEPSNGDLWDLKLEDLFSAAPAESEPQKNAIGPYVINLVTSVEPISVPTSALLNFERMQVYQVTAWKNDRLLFRLRLGPIDSELQANAMLADIMREYPDATALPASEDDIRMIAAVVASAAQRPATSGAKGARPPATGDGSNSRNNPVPRDPPPPPRTEKREAAAFHTPVKARSEPPPPRAPSPVAAPRKPNLERPATSHPASQGSRLAHSPPSWLQEAARAILDSAAPMPPVAGANAKRAPTPEAMTPESHPVSAAPPPDVAPAPLTPAGNQQKTTAADPTHARASEGREAPPSPAAPARESAPANAAALPAPPKAPAIESPVDDSLAITLPSLLEFEPEFAAPAAAAGPAPAAKSAGPATVDAPRAAPELNVARAPDPKPASAPTSPTPVREASPAAIEVPKALAPPVPLELALVPDTPRDVAIDVLLSLDSAVTGATKPKRRASDTKPTPDPSADLFQELTLVADPPPTTPTPTAPTAAATPAHSPPASSAEVPREVPAAIPVLGAPVGVPSPGASTTESEHPAKPAASPPPEVPVLDAPIVRGARREKRFGAGSLLKRLLSGKPGLASKSESRAPTPAASTPAVADAGPSSEPVVPPVASASIEMSSNTAEPATSSRPLAPAAPSALERAAAAFAAGSVFSTARPVRKRESPPAPAFVSTPAAIVPQSPIAAPGEPWHSSTLPLGAPAEPWHSSTLPLSGPARADANESAPAHLEPTASGAPASPSASSPVAVAPATPPKLPEAVIATPASADAWHLSTLPLGTSVAAKSPEPPPVRHEPTARLAPPDSLTSAVLGPAKAPEPAVARAPAPAPTPAAAVIPAATPVKTPEPPASAAHSNVAVAPAATAAKSSPPAATGANSAVARPVIVRSIPTPPARPAPPPSMAPKPREQRAVPAAPPVRTPTPPRVATPAPSTYPPAKPATPPAVEARPAARAPLPPAARTVPGAAPAKGLANAKPASTRQLEVLPGSGPALDSTQTMRALTLSELEAAQDEKLWVIQLLVSEAEILPDQVPNLAIFNEFRLYAAVGTEGGKVLHALRLGFFFDQAPAQAVAGYLSGYFDAPTVTRVSSAERERFGSRRVAARKDSGESGVHAAIDLSSPTSAPTTSLADLAARTKIAAAVEVRGTRKPPVRR